MNSTLEEIKKKIMSFDHTYEFSDDYRVWQAGNYEQKQIIEMTKNLSLDDKQKIRNACKAAYNSWSSGFDFDNDKDQVVQNKILALCGFSFRIYRSFEDLPEEYMEKFIEKTFNRMTDRGHLELLDCPIEEHPKYEWVVEVAKEDFLDAYEENGFIDNGRENV